MEGADGRRGDAQRGVPADQRHHRLVDVDDVVLAPAQLATRRDDAAGGEGARGWRWRRWRRSRPCGRAGSGSRASRATRGAARCSTRLSRPGDRRERARERDGHDRETPRQAPPRAGSRRPGRSRNMARRGQFARATKGNGRGRVGSRVGPGVADEDQQVGGADLQQQRAGVVGERADHGRGERPRPGPPASPGGPPARPRAARGAATPARRARRSSGRKTKTIGLREAVGGELQAALGDVGEVAEAAGVEHRAGQVGVGAGDEVEQGDQRQHRDRRGEHEQRRAPPPRPRSRPRPRRRRAGRRSRRRRRRRSARRRRRRRRAARRRGRRRRAARRVSRGAKPASAGAGPGDDEDREQRLELVADPVEAHAEPGIRPEQRERGERRAGDHVDRVGERRSSAGGRRPAPGSRRAATRVSAASSGAPNITSSCSAPWLGSSAAPSSSSSGR